MLKLVRLALTAAILTAIALRLRRRARLPAKEPAPPVPPVRARRSGMVAVWAGIAAIVVVVLAVALLPSDAADSSAEPADSPAGPTAPSAGPVTSAGPVMSAGPVTSAEPATSAGEPAASAASSPEPGQGEAAGNGCSPAPRPVTVRAVDSGVRRAVDRQWRRIERWLKANAPRTYKSLNTPGRASTIAVAESQMGVDFPDDLRASLLRHNGSTGFGFGLGDGAVAMSIREIRDAWREMCSPASVDAVNWNGRLIPFLSLPASEAGTGEVGAGEYAVVDSRGGAVSREGGAPARMPSYYALMRAAADALERGGEVGGRRPAVERGVPRWETP